jgi:hypothetical protein
MAINAQSIWTLQDPGGGAVRYNPDSAFVYHAEFEDFLAMYAIDGDGNRNILRTDGKSSEWLFVTGKPKNSSFSQFFRVEGDEVFFEMDSVWYLTRNSMTRADVFHNNRDTSQEFIYQRPIYFDHRIGIIATERSTGNKVLLVYNTVSGSRVRYVDSNGNDIRIQERVYLNAQHLYEDVYFVGSVFSVDSAQWTENGLYRIKAGDPELMLEIGERDEYQITAFEWFDSYLVDYPGNGLARVFLYDNSIDTLIEKTTDLFNGDNIVSAGFIRSSAASDDVFYLHSCRSIWNTKTQSGLTKYFFRDGCVGTMPQWEQVDLRGVQSVNFMSGIAADTMYFYNYDDPDHALVRANYKTGGRVRENTGIPLSTEYEIFAWDRNIYFVRYDGGENKLYAAVHNDDGSKFIESYSGQRIENPVNFYPVGEYMVIESKTDTGNVLFGYDRNVSSIKDEKKLESRITVYPNPSSQNFFIRFEEASSISNVAVRVYNSDGQLTQSNVNVGIGGIWLDMKGNPPGVYTIQILDDGITVGRKQVVLIE